MSYQIFQANALHLPFLKDKSVDLVLGSPPYCDARTYGRKDISRNCKDWIDWMMKVTRESCRVSRGLVIWVCAGVTRKGIYQPGPEGLLHCWWEQGGECWRPVYWHRKGIPGSGGKQRLSSCVEYCLFFTNCERGIIPYANNVAFGHPPKFGAGGAMSYRGKDGYRLNDKQRKQIKSLVTTGISQRDACRKLGLKLCVTTSGTDDNGCIVIPTYVPPEIANPGNLISTGAAGGGHLGDDIAHENEAPFSEKLVRNFIRAWCKPRGIILDPFCGSGTTGVVALKEGRNAILCDLRHSQCMLSERRLHKAEKRLARGFGLEKKVEKANKESILEGFEED